MSTLKGRMRELPPDRQKRIEVRANELIAEEMSLQALREALRLTQARMAKTLGIGQDGISRLEKRSDLLLSTLRSYIKALGGNLSLVVEFPNRKPILLSGFATIKKAKRA